jgi:hypothetical protein
MRAQSIDDVIGLNSMALLGASIVAQPFQPSTEIFPPQSVHKAAPQAEYSPSASTAAIPKFWLELHRYVSVARKP